MAIRYSDQEPLYGCVVAREGTTTGAGTVAGDNFIDTGLIGVGANSFISMLAVLYPGDPQNVDSKDIIGFNSATGRVTLAGAYKGVGAAIPAGVPYKIVTFRFVPAEVAALTTIAENDQYYDRVFFDLGTGIAGAAWPVGTPQVPSDVIADVITMCAARNLRTIQVHGALTLAAIMEHYNFVGYSHEDIADILNLGGQDVDGSHIEGLIVTGTQAGTGFLTLERCVIYELLEFQGKADYCDMFNATMSLRDGGYIDAFQCNSIYGVVTITVQAPAWASLAEMAGNFVLSAQDGGICRVDGFKGTLVIDAMTAGTCDIYANGADITINASCIGAGFINIYGNARVTDNHGAGTTVNDYTKETQLDTIETDIATVDTVVDAIKTKTDALPTDPADQSLIEAAIAAAHATTDAALVVIDNEIATIDTEVGAIETKLDTPANFMADLTTLETRLPAVLSAIRIGYLDQLDFNLQEDIALQATLAKQNRILCSMDFWGLPQEEVALTIAAGDKALPSVTVADLPDGATIVRAIAMFKFRMVENHTYAGENKLDGAQEIQVAASVDAINFVTGQFTLAQDAREGGDVIVGVIDIAATVNANGAYAFHWDLAKAIQTGINFNDVQMGLRIWYSV